MKISPEMAERVESLAENSSDQRVQSSSEAVVRFISQGRRSNAQACLSSLCRHFEYRALVSYFRDADIAAMQANFHQAMLISVLYLHMGPVNRQGYAASMGYCLLSGNPELIHWWAQCFAAELVQGMGKHPFCDTPGTYEHICRGLSSAALRDWPALEREALRGLAAEKYQYKSLPSDYRFLLALARGDHAGMQQALDELCKPAVVKSRNKEFTFGLYDGLLHGWGLIYARLAWLNGFALSSKHEQLPLDLVQAPPLAHYPNRLDFLEGFDMWKPFDQGDSMSVANVHELSPRPPHEPPLTVEQQLGIIRMYTRKELNERERQKEAELEAKQLELTRTVLVNRGWEALADFRNSKGEGFDGVYTQVLGGQKLVLITGNNPINGYGVQLTFNKDGDMQFSTPWMMKQLKKLPAASPARQAVERALAQPDAIRTAVAGVDNLDKEFRLIMIDGNQTEA